MSVDQDLTVVAEALDDDVVKQWLVSIVFHASVTRQRSNGSETRFSRSHVHEKKQPTLANKGSRKKVPRKLMLKTWWRPTITTNSNRETGKHSISSSSSPPDVQNSGDSPQT